MEEWRRGSTPTNVFVVPIDISDAKVYITYSQNNAIIVEKTNPDIVFEENRMIVALTQEDTLKFVPGWVEIQIRYVKESGEADASNILVANTTKILKDGEIAYV